MRVTLVVPDRDPGSPSGGDRYDARLAQEWPGGIVVRRAAGAWPRPDGADVRALGATLSTVGRTPVVLDGLVGCAVPGLVVASAAVRPTALLVHARLAAGSGAVGADADRMDDQEREALRAAHLVVTTSAWSAADLGRRYGLSGVVVARPGTDPAPVAEGSGAVPQLLVLAALTPVKNHLALLTALSRLRDRQWRLVVAGPAPDPAYAEHLTALASRLGVDDRVTWAGALEGPGLERVWHRTDLLVHPSRSETWGMVVTEALAHGIPAVVARGTGAQEALETAADGPGLPTGPDGGTAGAAVGVDDPDELAVVLGTWLDDPAVRASWRARALARRPHLPGWALTARTVAAAVGAVAG